MSRQLTVHDAPLPALAKALTVLNIPLVLCAVLCVASSVLGQILITLIPHYFLVFSPPHQHNVIAGFPPIGIRVQTPKLLLILIYLNTAAAFLDLILNLTQRSLQARRGHYHLVRCSHCQNAIKVNDNYQFGSSPGPVGLKVIPDANASHDSLPLKCG